LHYILERAIDHYLSWYFASNDPLKYEELILLIFANERISFESKRQIFTFLLKKHHDPFLIKNPNLIKDLIYIIEQRNILAHYDYDSDELTKDGLTQINFVKYKNTLDFIPIDSKKLKDLRRKIDTSLVLIADFMRNEMGIE